MMVEWAAEQGTEMKREALDIEFLPTGTNTERGVQNLEFVLQQVHTALMALTIFGCAENRGGPMESDY